MSLTSPLCGNFHTFCFWTLPLHLYVIHPGLDTSVHHNWNALIECDKYKDVYTFLISYNTEGGWRTNDGYQALRPNPACAPCPAPEVAKR